MFGPTGGPAKRKERRPWIGQPPVPVPSFAALAKTTKDRFRVEQAFARMQDALRHPYLENERALPPALLASERYPLSAAPYSR